MSGENSIATSPEQTPHNHMSLSGRRERIESKGVGIAEIPEVESTQESKASDAIEASRTSTT
jgi:hypothetical protein